MALEAIMTKTADLVGAITANAYMVLIIMMFVARILGWSQAGRWIGISSSLVLLYMMRSIRLLPQTVIPDRSRGNP